MTEFRPIPGVWYENRSSKRGRARFLYAPDSDTDSIPWLCEGDWIGRDCVPDDLVEAFNPHPPTRTEWAVKSGDDLFESLSRADAVNDAAHYRKNWPQDPVKLLRRQVSETEWVEVDDD